LVKFQFSGFDGTRNLLAGILFGISIKGTHAHSFICSFSSVDDLKLRSLKSNDGSVGCDLHSLSKGKRQWIMEKVGWDVLGSGVNDGELAAFVSYAIASQTQVFFSSTPMISGVINFISVTLALFLLGYRSVECRIDSGNLAYLSKEVRRRLRMVAGFHFPVNRLIFWGRYFRWIEFLLIVASNDINEETIISLNEHVKSMLWKWYSSRYLSKTASSLLCVQGMITGQCKNLVVVVKNVVNKLSDVFSTLPKTYFHLVVLSGHQKFKLNQELSKNTIPGLKRSFRLYGKSGFYILDLIVLEEEQDRVCNKPLLCRHPSEDRVNASWKTLREHHRRYLNPTPYKVSVSKKFYVCIHKIWLQNAPIGQLE
uniref:nicotinate phosphoribosyltransferase n=1 Tax=Angiostrongylus costaricensis TaxID=334426 RepID=A0A0R3PWS0_ANGCS